MKHFAIRTSFFFTLFTSLIIGLALSGSPAFAAQPVPKASQSVKSIPQQPVININTADAVALTQLKGVGEKKAQAIIEYRNEHGSFQSIDELAEVKGIGEAIVNSNRELIVLK